MPDLQDGVSQVPDATFCVLVHLQNKCYPLICRRTPQTPLLSAPPPLPTPMPSHCASGACGRPLLMSRCGAWAAGSGCCVAAWSTFLPATGGTLQAGPLMTGASTNVCLLQQQALHDVHCGHAVLQTPSHDVERRLLWTGRRHWVSPEAQLVQPWALQSPSADWPVSTCRAGINGVLISWFAASVGKPALQQQVARLMELTGAYSISGLIYWLGRLRSLDGQPCSSRHHHHADTDLPSRQALALHVLSQQVLAALSLLLSHTVHQHAAPACCTSMLQAHGFAAMQAS